MNQALEFDLFNEHLKNNLARLKIVNFTPIQIQSFPTLLARKNLIGLSETGSGKTYAYLLPILENIKNNPKKNPSVLILAPTKELARQITEETKKLCRNTTLLSTLILGGQNINEQARDLKKGQHVVVGTPGRIEDLVIKEFLQLQELDYIVLDEGDTMMDMGFRAQLDHIFQAVNPNACRCLFSATLNAEVEDLIGTYIPDAMTINIDANKSKDTIDECYLKISRKEKLDFIKFLIKKEKIKSAIIFSNTKVAAQTIYENLKASKYQVGLIHGDLSVLERKRVIEKIKNKDISFLVATDVAARGIDISHLTSVINAEIPQNKESYIHRIGRTGRTKKISGKSYILSEENFEEIKKLELSPKLNELKLEGYQSAHKK